MLFILRNLDDRARERDGKQSMQETTDNEQGTDERLLKAFAAEGDEAATALGCPVSTAGNRLARGRELLRKRLAARGLGLSVAALGGLLSAEAGAEVLPATFVSATVKAAGLAAAGKLAAGVGAGTVSAHVAALTTEALKAMFYSQLKIAAAIAAVLTVAITGVVVAQHAAQGPKPAEPFKTPSAAAPAERTCKVEVSCLIPKTVASFAGQVLEIRLYKIHPMIADKPADLVEMVEVKDFTHTTGQDTKKDISIGAQAKLDPTMRYYLTCFVLDGRGRRTHMGEPNNGQMPCKVLTEGNPNTAAFKIRKVG
jgi:hypothetical protein